MPVECDQTLAHYRLVEKIGEGGMGVVYRARDASLDREVAVKVLPTGALADAAARRQFRKEALALSRLNHPNIETVHAFERQEGVDFLVMEYIPGVTLDKRLAAGPLAEQEVARLGAQLAQGLAAAHAQGIVHGDLKPGNLRLRPDGWLKILDFGLAKWLEGGGEARTTERLMESESGAGTLPYMAPEQLRRGDIDPRSDIYAAGAVLYEMATGRRPFAQTSPARLIEAILNQTPPNPGAINPRISSALESIIVKALDKDPGRRYQTAREMQVDLERLGAAPPLRGPRRWGWFRGVRPLPLAGGMMLVVLFALAVVNRSGVWERLIGGMGAGRLDSIAVLPLDNLSGDPGQEYLADGITDGLITNLAQIGSLRVISRTSVMQYKGAHEPLPEIARKLNVQAVVEGTVRRSGDRVRISSQLIEAATDRHLWARTYEREVRDITVLESEIAQAISATLRVELTPDEKTRFAQARPVNPVAQEAYLKGRYFLRRQSEEGFKKAIQYFEEAIAADPDWAPPYVKLGSAYAQLEEGEFLPPSEASPKVKAALTKALELDDSLSEAHSYLGARMMGDWDWSGAERELKRAIELDSSNAQAWRAYAYWLDAMGRHTEALDAAKRALAVDPVPMFSKVVLAYIHHSARQYDKAIEQFQEALEMDPQSPMLHMGLAGSYVELRRFDDAIAEARKAIAQSEGSTESLATLGDVYARAGMRDEARKVLAELANLSKRKYVSSAGVALIHADLGDRDQAFASLEEAYRNRDTWLAYLKVFPSFDPLRSDPRFADLVRRVGLPPD